MPTVIWYVSATPIGTYIRISNIRFLQMAAWIPCAIGTAWFFEWAYTRMKPWMIGSFFVGIFVLTLVGYPWAIQNEYQKLSGGDAFQFPTKGYMQAIGFIKTITKQDDVVLALPLTGQIIPSYVNRTVYTGSELFYTKDLSRKMDETWAFYHATPLCDAYSLVQKNNIRVVFYGFDEQQAGNAVFSYPFLRLVGSFGTTQLFTVSDDQPKECN
jgi:hypothetical protein